MLWGQGQLRSFWRLYSEFKLVDTVLDHRRLRGGPGMGGFKKMSYFGSIGSNENKNLFGSVSQFLEYMPAGNGGQSVSSLDLSWQLAPNIAMSIGGKYVFNVEDLQFVSGDRDNNLYVLGRLKQNVLSSQLRLDYLFTKYLSLQFFGQVFCVNR